MNNRFESFPILNEEAIRELNVNVNSLNAEYTFNNVKNYLEFITEDNNNEYILDNNGVWTSTNNDLQIRGEIEIDNFNILFEEQKVAEKETTLGIAITCVLLGSNKIYTKSIGEITYSSVDSKKLEFFLNFKEGELSPIMNLRFSLFVKNAKSHNSIFARTNGTVLGDILNLNLIIEGQGSEFPIVTIESPKDPLWNMEIEFENLDDVFSMDTICLKINKSHKDFSQLGIDKVSKNNNLIWKEILASFFTNLFLTANEIENLEKLLDEEQEEGTVGGFLKLQLTQFNLSINELKNPILLSKNIRKELDNLI